MSKQAPSTSHAASNVPELPEDLRELVEHARAAGSAVRIAQAEYAYRLSLLALRAAGHRLGCVAAISAAATALGISRQTLQPYAVLAARWAPEDLRALFKLRTTHGRPLSVTHFLVLARLPRSKRDALIARALREGLDARTLRTKRLEGGYDQECPVNEADASEDARESTIRLKTAAPSLEAGTPGYAGRARRVDT